MALKCRTLVAGYTRRKQQLHCNSSSSLEPTSWLQVPNCSAVHGVFAKSGRFRFEENTRWQYILVGGPASNNIYVFCLHLPAGLKPRLLSSKLAIMRSVDCWPLAIDFARHLGVNLNR
jgi:hypothetical protein